MSYTQSDAAIELWLQLATVDTTTMDPDELAEVAEKAVANARYVRDSFTEDGYLKGDGE